MPRCSVTAHGRPLCFPKQTGPERYGSASHAMPEGPPQGYVGAGHPKPLLAVHPEA